MKLDVEGLNSSNSHQKPEAAAADDVDEDARFNKSLLELKDLRSQLHYAARYCEASFFNSKEKNMVMENTKEYICRALVTVVDHVGSASSNLESMVLKNEQFTDTAARVSCLQQRLVMCQEYAGRVTIPKLCWTETFQKHHTHYTSLCISIISALSEQFNVYFGNKMLIFSDTNNVLTKVFVFFATQIATQEDVEKSSDVVRKDIEDPIVPKTMPKYNTDAEKARPLLIFKYGRQASLTKLPLPDINNLKQHITNSSSVLPIGDPFAMSIPRNPSFHFQETKKVGRNEQNRRLLQLPWRKPYKIH